MAIEGDLKSLNLPSILQLITQEHLTGVLKIKRRSDIVDVGFIDSQITGAFFERGDSVERLEAYLVRSGIIKKNLYAMIEEIHQETKRPIMSIIIEDKYVTAAEIERIIAFKVQEVLDEVFTWQEGAFKFEEGSVIYPKSTLKVRLKIEPMLLEAARRSDEWPRITKQIPSADLVFKRVERPELKIKLPEDEERVITLVDGERCVTDIIEISGLGKFHTYSCLYHLLSSGQIELAYAKPQPDKNKPKPLLRLNTLAAPAAIVVTALILLLEFLVGNNLASRRAISVPLVQETNPEPVSQDLQEIFFYKHHRTPGPTEIRSVFPLSR